MNNLNGKYKLKNSYPEILLDNIIFIITSELLFSIGDNK
jgi:hypothetical protein